MTESKEDTWQLGEGSFVLNENASVDTLLIDSAEWLAHAWYLADEIARHLSGFQSVDAQDMRNKLSTVRVFSRMSLQCVRKVRRRLVMEQWEPRKV